MIETILSMAQAKKCYSFGEIGHVANTCLYKKRCFFNIYLPGQLQNDTFICHYCGGISHKLSKKVYNTSRGRGVLKECEGAERRQGTPSRLFWAQQDMTAPEPREYEPEDEGNTPAPSVSRARVAPQARPTITVEERPRGPMPVSNPELEARWNAAHIND